MNILTIPLAKAALLDNRDEAVILRAEHSPMKAVMALGGTTGKGGGAIACVAYLSTVRCPQGNEWEEAISSGPLKDGAIRYVWVFQDILHLPTPMALSLSLGISRLPSGVAEELHNLWEDRKAARVREELKGIPKARGRKEKTGYNYGVASPYSR